MRATIVGGCFVVYRPICQDTCSVCHLFTKVFALLTAWVWAVRRDNLV